MRRDSATQFLEIERHLQPSLFLKRKRSKCLRCETVAPGGATVWQQGLQASGVCGAVPLVECCRGFEAWTH
jgi:hypothetical protein